MTDWEPNMAKSIPRRRAAAAVTRHRGESGSAYIIALLVLVVLTIIGLALTLITQTEVAIGSNERDALRTFYATDSFSGLVKGMMANQEDHNVPITNNTTQQDTGKIMPVTFADQVTVTPLIQTNVQPCFICDMGSDPTLNYKAITHILNSNDSRTGLTSISGTPQAIPITEKLIATQILLEPWQPSVSKNQSNDVTNDIQKMKPPL
jgi:hypothetical protein